MTAKDTVLFNEALSLYIFSYLPITTQTLISKASFHAYLRHCLAHANMHQTDSAWREVYNRLFLTLSFDHVRSTPDSQYRLKLFNSNLSKSKYDKISSESAVLIKALYIGLKIKLHLLIDDLELMFLNRLTTYPHCQVAALIALLPLNKSQTIEKLTALFMQFLPQEFYNTASAIFIIYPNISLENITALFKQHNRDTHINKIALKKLMILFKFRPDLIVTPTVLNVIKHQNLSISDQYLPNWELAGLIAKHAPSLNLIDDYIQTIVEKMHVSVLAPDRTNNILYALNLLLKHAGHLITKSHLDIFMHEWQQSAHNLPKRQAINQIVSVVLKFASHLMRETEPPIKVLHDILASPQSEVRATARQILQLVMNNHSTLFENTIENGLSKINSDLPRDIMIGCQILGVFCLEHQGKLSKEVISSILNAINSVPEESHYVFVREVAWEIITLLSQIYPEITHGLDLTLLTNDDELDLDFRKKNILLLISSTHLFTSQFLVSVIVSPDKSEPRALASGFPLPDGHGSVGTGEMMTEAQFFMQLASHNSIVKNHIERYIFTELFIKKQEGLSNTVLKKKIEHINQKRTLNTDDLKLLHQLTQWHPYLFDVTHLELYLTKLTQDSRMIITVAYWELISSLALKCSKLFMKTHIAILLNAITTEMANNYEQTMANLIYAVPELFTHEDLIHLIKNELNTNKTAIFRVLAYHSVFFKSHLSEMHYHEIYSELDSMQRFLFDTQLLKTHYQQYQKPFFTKKREREEEFCPSSYDKSLNF